MPAAVTAVIAGSPSRVAGILMSTFGLSTAAHSAFAEAIVASVSLARVGSTSIETRPSSLVAAATGARMSHALRTSSVVSSKITLSTSAPALTSSATWASYRSPLLIAPWKMVGFVVTPTTELSATSEARLPVSIRSRERSSSQMDTPASASALRRSLMVFSLVSRPVTWPLRRCCPWRPGPPSRR